MTPPGQMLQMHETGSRTSYLRVRGAGHLVHDEAADTYRAAVTAFLSTLAQHA